MRGSNRGATTLSVSPFLTEYFYSRIHTDSLGKWLRAPFDLLLLWDRRCRQRQHLVELDARMLRDIGVTDRAAHREAGKPFWRA